MPNIHIIKEACLPSTNAALKQMAQKGAPEGTVLLADRQTAGYGRHARAFFSPEGTGLYMSVLLRPRFSAEAAPMITVMAAVALCEAIEDAGGMRAEIKWVNDIYVNGKKAAGILTESSFSADGARAYAVLGVGINLFTPKSGFPEGLSHVTAVFDQGRSGEFLSLREALCKAFLARFFGHYEKMPSRGFVDEYRRRSFLIGRSVTVYNASVDPMKKGEGRRACVLDVTDGASLLVRYEDGTRAVLLSGEVTLDV